MNGNLYYIHLKISEVICIVVPYLNLIPEKLNNQTLRRLRGKDAGAFCLV